MLVKVEELTGDLSRVRLFHTSVSRAIASWPTWPGEPGFTGDFAEYLAQKFPTSTAADFAILEAGVTSEETYVEQGLYWSTGHEPMLEYVVEKYDPDLLLVGMPTTDEFQHQFLGLVSPKLPNGAPNPAYDDVDLNGVAGRPRRRARGVHPHGVPGGRRGPDARPQADGQGPDDVRRLRPRLRAAVPGDRRQPAARRAGPALAAADVELPPGHGRDDRQGQGLLGRRRRADLPQRRRPRSGRRRLHSRSRRPTSPRPWQRSRRSTSASTDPNDWTHDGQPEGWKMIDRAFTKAEARYIPNGPEQRRPTWPIRPGRATSSRSRTRRTSSTRRRRARSSRRRTSSASTATCRTSRTWPRTSTCGRRSSPAATGSARAQVTARTIDLAPTLAFLLGIPEPQHSQGKVLLDVVKRRDKRTSRSRSSG